MIENKEGNYRVDEHDGKCTNVVTTSGNGKTHIEGDVKMCQRDEQRRDDAIMQGDELAAREAAKEKAAIKAAAEKAAEEHKNHGKIKDRQDVIVKPVTPLGTTSENGNAKVRKEDNDVI